MTRECKMLSTILTVAVVVAAGLAAPLHVALAQEAAKNQAKEKPMSVWMERKLHLSQDLLAGITAGDFDKIAASAQAMRGLNKVEAFVRSRTPGYRTQLQIFDESLAEIVKQAENDNVEGAALGFTQLTISCVNCHKQLRQAK